MNVLRVTSALLIVLAVAACGGGGGKGAISLPSQADGAGDENALRIVTFTAAPTTGGSPLGVNYIATVTGGKLPYTYMWDYDSDGAFDFYINEVGSRTEQTYHLYYLRDVDIQQRSSIYQAVVRVVDDEGTSRTSEPITVVVTDEPQFALDMTLTRIISDSVIGYDERGEPIYAYMSGEPIYCRVFPDPANPGTPPYRYQWDFDVDGRIDSTLQNPQYTFTLMEEESQTFIIKLTVTDTSNYTIVREFPITVVKELPDEPVGAPELIVVSFPPILADGSILIEFDSSSDLVEEREPRLNASVTVDPEHPGLLPYSFFWDFTNDGIYDANTTSASVPYYDSDLSILLNPYKTWGDPSRDFTLALHFVDGIGQIVHHEWPVRVVDRAYEPTVNPLLAQTLVDLNEDGQFEENEQGTYAEQAIEVRPESGATIGVRVSASGTTGDFRFLLDILGNGVYAEDINEDGNLEWDPNYDGTYENVDLDGDTENQDATVLFSTLPEEEIATFTIIYPPNLLPGYKAIRSKVVALSAGGLEVAARVGQAPVSFVRRTAVQYAGGDPLIPRRDFGAAAVTVIDNGGTPESDNDTLLERRIFLIGGMDGNIALRSVQLVKQSYQVLATGSGWAAQVFVSDRLPLPTPRGQLVADPLYSVVFQDAGTQIYAIGGYNNIEQTVSVVEMLPSNDGDDDDYPTVPWTTVGSIGNSNVELRHMASVSGLSSGGNPWILLFGGLRGDPPNEQVSPTGWRYIPTQRSWDSSFLAPMPTPRYDAAMVFDYLSPTLVYVYVIGGRNNQGVSTRAVERLNMLTGGWEIMPDMKYARAGTTAEIINGKIYVYGGTNYPQDRGDPEIVNVAEVFNPTTYMWSETISAESGIGRAGASSMQLPSYLDADGNIMPSDTIVVVGGETEGGYLTSSIVQLQVEAFANLQ